jgi:hypothetical protein
MAYQSKADALCAEIEDALQNVRDAMTKHSKGGSVASVTRANERLARAHCNWREHMGGNVCHER